MKYNCYHNIGLICIHAMQNRSLVFKAQEADQKRLREMFGTKTKSRRGKRDGVLESFAWWKQRWNLQLCFEVLRRESKVRAIWVLKKLRARFTCRLVYYDKYTIFLKTPVWLKIFIFLFDWKPQFDQNCTTKFDLNSVFPKPAEIGFTKENYTTDFRIPEWDNIRQAHPESPSLHRRQQLQPHLMVAHETTGSERLQKQRTTKRQKTSRWIMLLSSKT